MKDSLKKIVNILTISALFVLLIDIAILFIKGDDDAKFFARYYASYVFLGCVVILYVVEIAKAKIGKKGMS